jgi:hypothetical protein
MGFLGSSLPRLLEEYVSKLTAMFILELIYPSHISRLTDDNMADEFDGGIAEGTLPQAFHPFYHIYVFEEPRTLRYRPHVENFRNLLNSTTSAEKKQACIAKITDQTTRMNRVSGRIPNYSVLILTSDFMFCMYGPPGCTYVPAVVPLPRMVSIFGTREAAKDKRVENPL